MYLTLRRRLSDYSVRQHWGEPVALSSTGAHDAELEPGVPIVDKSGKSAGTLRLKRAMEIDRKRRKT
jgi:hypothetical protein